VHGNVRSSVEQGALNLHRKDALSAKGLQWNVSALITLGFNEN